MKVADDSPTTLILHQSDCIDDGKTWYGMARHGGRSMGKHRRAWIEANGEIPEGMFVLHSCDNKSCYNVDHLFLGTQAENMQDMVRKGRRVKNYGARKLTLDQVEFAKREYARGRTQGAIALTLGVHRNTIWRALKGETYASS